MYSTREATVHDLPALRRSLAWAIEWRSPMLSAPAEVVIRRTGHDYLLDEWGRAGDVAVVADAAGASVGAAWYRRGTEELHAMTLYEKSGFSRLELVVDSWTMVRELEGLAPPI